MTKALRGGAVTAVCVLWLTLVGAASAQVGTQSVAAPDGAYGWGQVKVWGADGRFLRFDATFVEPRGAAGTGTANGLDLSQPVGVLRIEEVTPPAGPGTWGSSRPLCAASDNARNFAAGRTIPARNADGSQGLAWTGFRFDIECKSEMGFDFFRVHFDHGMWNGEPYAAQRFEPRESEVRTARGRDLTGLETETAYLHTGGQPITSDVYHQWSAPGRLGTVIAEPLARQGAELTLCGHRAGAAPKCWKGESVGLVFPVTAGLTHTVGPW